MDHTIIYFEIPAPNFGKLKKFYAGLLGWKIEKYLGPVEYWMTKTVPVDEKGLALSPGVNGGMVRKESPNQKPVNYISVENIDGSMEKVKTLGGKTMSLKQEVPKVGWIAAAVDPEGNQIALL